MKGSVCFVLKFAPPLSPLEGKFLNKTGTEPFIPEYHALHRCTLLEFEPLTNMMASESMYRELLPAC